jgi:hypothetical protein
MKECDRLWKTTGSWSKMSQISIDGDWEWIYLVVNLDIYNYY